MNKAKPFYSDIKLQKTNLIIVCLVRLDLAGVRSVARQSDVTPSLELFTKQCLAFP